MSYMHRLIYTLFGLIWLWNFCSSQDTIRSQTELEAFLASSVIEERSSGFVLTDGPFDLQVLSDLHTIRGDLKLSNIGSKTNMAPLALLDSISGQLSIYRCNIDSIDWSGSDLVVGGIRVDSCRQLKFFSGLHHQSMIDNAVFVNLPQLRTLSVGSRCDSILADAIVSRALVLDSLSILDNVNYVGGSLFIASCLELSKINGYDELKTVSEIFAIRSLPKLKHIVGFNQLETVGSAFAISTNVSLDLIHGFDRLTSVGREFKIRISMADLSVIGFHSLKSVQGSGAEGFTLGELRLEEFDAFDALVEVPELDIFANWIVEPEGLPVFESLGQADEISLSTTNNVEEADIFKGLVSTPSMQISGMVQLTHLSDWEVDLDRLDMLRIQGNRRLANCSVPWVCEYLRLGGQHMILDNAPGCNSRNEIFQNCVFTSDTEETEAEMELEIVPHPVVDRLYVETDCEDCTYVIRDMAGQLMTTSQEATIDVSALPPGSYILQSLGTTHTYTQKFLKL